jgi:hypothetical protein
MRFPSARGAVAALRLGGGTGRIKCGLLAAHGSGAPDGASRPFRYPVGPPAESGVAGGDDGLAALG